MSDIERGISGFMYKINYFIGRYGFLYKCKNKFKGALSTLIPI